MEDLNEKMYKSELTNKLIFAIFKSFVVNSFVVNSFVVSCFIFLFISIWSNRFHFEKYLKTQHFESDYTVTMSA